MAAFLSNYLPAVVVEALQHVANPHQEDGERLLRILYGLPAVADKPSGGQSQRIDLLDFESAPEHCYITQQVGPNSPSARARNSSWSAFSRATLLLSFHP